MVTTIFYWKELVSYNDLTTDKLKQALSIQVPSTWSNYAWNDSDPKSYGYGTYVVEFITEPGVSIGITIPYIPTDYNLFINEELIGKSGNVSQNGLGSQPNYITSTSEFVPTTEKTYMILQVSNHDDFISGIFSPIEIGLTEHVNEERMTSIMQESFLITCVLLFMVFHILLLINGRSENEIYWFIVIGICSALIASIHPFSSIMLTFYYSNLSFRFTALLILTITALLPLSLVYYYSALFSGLISVKFKFVALFIFIVTIVAMPFLSVYLVFMMSFFVIIYTLIVVILLMLLLMKLALKSNENAFIASISLFVLLTPILHDIMNVSSSINATFVLNQCLLIFILFNSYLIASKYTKAYFSLEEVNEALKQDQLEIIQQGQLVTIGQIAGSIAYQIRDPLKKS